MKQNIDPTYMTQRSDLIEQARHAVFSKPLLERYIFEPVSEKVFWDYLKTSFYMHAPLDLFFLGEKLRSAHEINNLSILNQWCDTYHIEDNFLIKDIKSNTVVALFRGWQKNFDSYYMQFSAVHQDYRKQGIYSALVDKVLFYTKTLGFTRVLSTHAPFNNAILIAKLKKDFKIIGTDIDPELGINVWLCYFHNEELKRAYELRCGKLEFSKPLYEASLGTAEQLVNILEESKI